MPELAVLHVSGIESTNGVSPGFSTIDARGRPMKEIGVSIDISAQTGTTPTINFSIEWSPDNVNWGDAETADDFSEIAAATPTVSKRFTVKAPYFRLVWAILPVPVGEIQSIVHNHTSGTFNLSYDTEGPSEPLEWDAPVDAVLAAGLLTMDVEPSPGIAAQGLLTIAEDGVAGDTFTLGTTAYRLMDSIVQAYDIAIGADVAATRLNIVAAINESGVVGTQYNRGTVEHPDVSAAAFVGSGCVLTADVKGTAGDAIVTTETFDGDTNIFDDTTLGTETAGVEPDTVTIGATTYRFQDIPTETDDVGIGANLGESQVNLVLAVASNPDVTMAAFGGDTSVVTATSTIATVGDAVVTTETFAAGTNIFDATTLGATTAPINGVETALERFTNTGDLTVVRNGNGDWDVTFPLGEDDVALMTGDDSGLSGGSSFVIAEETVGSSVYYTFYAVAI